MLKQAVVLCAVISVALAALALAPLETKPDKYKDVPGCFVGNLDTVIPFGEARPSNESCMEYRCSEDHVTYVTCGVAKASPLCTVEQNLEETYPDCCPKIVCPPNQNESN